MPTEPSADLAVVAPRSRGGGRHLAVLRSWSLRAMAGRLSWGLADQAVSSLTNFAVGAFVARSLGVAAFGSFTLAWVTYGVVLNISRGLATDPLAVRFSGVATDLWRHAVARSSGTALGIGAAAGAASVFVGLALGGSLGSAFLGLGIVLPALMLQDSWRFAFFAAGEGRRAFANDMLWAAALVPAMILAVKHGSVFGFVLAWGLCGAVAAGYGCYQTGILPRWNGVVEWLKRQRDLGLPYMAGNLLDSGAVPLRMYALGAIAGLAGVAAVRGAQLLQGPFLALLMGVGLVSVPEAVRVLQRSERRLPLFGFLIGAGQAAAALLWGLALLILLPDGVGRYVLGPVWALAAPLILPTTLAVMGFGCCMGASASLRALGAAHRSLRAQLICATAFVTGGIGGAAVAGALGSAWGVAIAAWFEACVWWLQLRAGMREHTILPMVGPPGVEGIQADHQESGSS